MFWNEKLSRNLLEYGLEDNAPRAARAFALLNIAFYDSFVACWDAKYTYWTERPFQHDPAFQPLFANPSHPSYPSAHSCLSGVSADVLGYLFPREAEGYQALAVDIAVSRLWAGIHFRSDVVVGLDLAHLVGNKVIEYAENDGSK